MAWFFLLLAGLTEIGWAVGMKYTNGFTPPAAQHRDVGMHRVEPVFAVAGVESDSVGHGLRGLDGHWCRGHGAARHDFF